MKHARTSSGAGDQELHPEFDLPPDESHDRHAANIVITEIVRFGISGTAGFIVDAGLVYLCTNLFDLGPLVAQVIAFSVAVTVTWLINRHWTFAAHASDRWLREWTHYVAANSVGALVINGIYAILVIESAFFSQIPALAVASGSLAGMLFNYSLSKRFIFRTTNDTNKGYHK